MADNDRTVISGPPVDAVQPGVELNGMYEIDEHIASGGMGGVYRGHNIHTGDPVAIKIVLPEFARDEAILQMFKKEASILNHLSHDAIVRYHGFSIDKAIGRYYMAMEFVDGTSLADRIERKGALSPSQARSMLFRVASGLALAHEAGVIHRDLSPDNVILPQGNVNKSKIIDFGIARSTTNVGGGTLLGGKFAGKYNFVSPEQLGLFGGDVTEKSDIYSLGLVLAAALRGQALDMSGSLADTIEKRRSVPDLGDIDPELRVLCEAMLQPDPAYRPQSAADIVEWLRPAMGRSIPPTATTRPEFPAPPPASMPAAAAPAMPPAGSAAPAAPQPPPGSWQQATRISQPPQAMPFPPSQPPQPFPASQPPRPMAPSEPTQISFAPPPFPGSRPPADAPPPAPPPAYSQPPTSWPQAGTSLPPQELGFPPSSAAGGSLPPLRGVPLETLREDTGLPTPAVTSYPASPPPPADRQAAKSSGGKGGLIAAGIVVLLLAGGAGAWFGGVFDKAPPATVAADSPPPVAEAPKADRPQPSEPQSPPEQPATPTPPPQQDAAKPAEEAPATPAEPTTPATPDPGTQIAGVPQQVGSGVDWVNRYDGGTCFHAAVTSVSDSGIGIVGFGTSRAPFERLMKAYEQDNGTEPDIQVRPIQQAQCAVAEFLKAIKVGNRNNPSVTLSKDRVSSKEAFRVTIGDLGDRTLTLLLVDDAGGVYNLDRSWDRRKENSIGLALEQVKSSAALPHLVVAIASPNGLQNADVKKDFNTSALFDALRSEIEKSGPETGVGVGYFLLGQ